MSTGGQSVKDGQHLLFLYCPPPRSLEPLSGRKPLLILFEFCQYQQFNCFFHRLAGGLKMDCRVDCESVHNFTFVCFRLWGFEISHNIAACMATTSTRKREESSRAPPPSPITTSPDSPFLRHLCKLPACTGCTHSAPNYSFYCPSLLPGMAMTQRKHLR